jgi:hypothetical protein
VASRARFERGTARRGARRDHQANLIPPGLLKDHPDFRVLDGLPTADRADLLVDYLGVSEAQLVKTADRLAADGEYVPA